MKMVPAKRHIRVGVGGSLLRNAYPRRGFGGEKDPRSFSRRVDHSGYLSGLNLQPSGQRSDVLPAQPSGQLWGKQIYPMGALAETRDSARVGTVCEPAC